MMNQSNSRQRIDADQSDHDSVTELPGQSVPHDVEAASTDDISNTLPVSISSDADFHWAIVALNHGRDEILANWLRATREQPFHAARPDRSVSDHIPRLFDAVVAFLSRTSRSWREPGTPLNDPAVLEAANNHAYARAEQGLQPSDVVTEFRLLRRAIWQGLRDHLVDLDSIDDLVNAELLVNDTIDGAITVGLEKLSARVEGLREDFLVGTIHDIRQPITAIKGLTQLSRRFLARNEPEVDRVRRSLDGIEEQVDQMNRTIDVLIDVSRAALGHLTLEPAFVDLALLLPEIVEQNGLPDLCEVRMTLPQAGVSTGYWDEMRLRQVFANLLSNAMKYSPSGNLIEIMVQATDEMVNVSVRDFGMGIEADELPRIFDRYYRTARVVRDAMDGSGIGLYLCRQVIEAHGGTIWAESDGPETGTTVRFTLPRNSISQSVDNEL